MLSTIIFYSVISDIGKQFRGSVTCNIFTSKLTQTPLKPYLATDRIAAKEKTSAFSSNLSAKMRDTVIGVNPNKHKIKA
jgi:hypothetical protein